MLLTGKITDEATGSGWIYDGEEVIEVKSWDNLYSIALKQGGKCSIFLSDPNHSALISFAEHLLSRGIQPSSLNADRETVWSLQIGGVSFRNFYDLVPLAPKKIMIMGQSKDPYTSMHEAIKIFSGMIAPIPIRGTLGATSWAFFEHWAKDMDIDIPSFDLPGLKIMRRAYYGGRVEVYKRSHEHGQAHDRNSSYLTAMTEELPVGAHRVCGPREKIQNGLVSATVRVPHNEYIGPLPYRSRSIWEEKLYFPTGTWSAWFSWNELEYMESNGHVQIERVHGSIQWEATEPIIQEYAQYLWSARSRARCPAQRAIYKLLGNSLAGKLAQHYKTERVVFGKPKKGYVAIGNGKIFVRPVVMVPKNALYHWASYITGSARTALHEALRTSIDLAYCDTDSVWSERFPDALKGNGLGDWKREHEYSQLLVAGGKMYAYNEAGRWKTTKHFKRIKEFFELYNGNKELTRWQKKLREITSNRDLENESYSVPYSVNQIKKEWR